MLDDVVARFDSPEAKRKLGFLVYIVFFAFAWRTWSILWRFAVDVPFWDEWSLVSGIGRPFSLDWILGTHNEHRLALTRLTGWLQYYVDGLNVRHTILFNFFVYFAFVWMLWKYCAREWLTKLLLPLFAWSTLPIENTSWGFQSCYLYCVMFFMASFLIGLPSESPKPNKMKWLALPLAVATVFSFGVGVVGCAGLVLLWAVFGYFYREERVRFWVSSGVLVGALVYWLSGYHSVSQHPNSVFFTEAAFWKYWLNALSSAIGYTQSLNVLPGMAIVGILLGYLGYCWRRGVLFETKTIQTIWPGITACMSLLVITSGRVGISIDQSKVSRYTTIGLMFLPVIFDAISVFIKEVAKTRKFLFVAMTGAALVILVPLYDQFHIKRKYREAFVSRETGLECIKKYYAGHNGALCEMLYPVAISGFLDEAKTKGMSFTQAIK